MHDQHSSPPYHLGYALHVLEEGASVGVLLNNLFKTNLKTQSLFSIFSQMQEDLLLIPSEHILNEDYLLTSDREMLLL